MNQNHQNSRIAVYIFNYNLNENAQRLKAIFEPHFPTYIFDSGSNPPCPNAIHYDNIYYGGMFNEAIKKSRSREWCCIITSDVQIDDQFVQLLPERMKQIAANPSVGNYQPSCHHAGRSHQYGYNKSTGNFREVPYFEGWFQMFRTSLGFSLDLSLNRIGWGPDLYLCKRARDRKLKNVVDDAVVVNHPKDTGFSNHEASQQMNAWAATLPDFENQINVGVGIICYEGTEHLRTIIQELRPHVDNITLLWSQLSYDGTTDADKKDSEEVSAILADGLADDIIYFPYLSHVPPREQETIRRNQGLAYFQSKGYEYALIMDSDEFYQGEQFAAAKDLIRRWLPASTYVQYRNYYKHKDCMLNDDLFGTPRVVPFLCSTAHRFQYNIPFKAPSDPTRRMKTDCEYFLPPEMITMHHWSWIRTDIRKKIMSWSAGDMFPMKELEEMIDYYEKFDSRQTYVRIPHKMMKNKIEVRWQTQK
jgi:hypothetical protein